MSFTLVFFFIYTDRHWTSDPVKTASLSTILILHFPTPHYFSTIQNDYIIVHLVKLNHTCPLSNWYQLPKANSIFFYQWIKNISLQIHKISSISSFHHYSIHLQSHFVNKYLGFSFFFNKLSNQGLSWIFCII